jgi:quinol---cytochrome c reductase iron-sulfur subunit, bacillus type
MAPSQDRRSFLRWATHGLGAIFAAVLGTPVVLYLIDPRNRKGEPSEYRLVDGVRLDDERLQGNNPLPVQGVIRAVRLDGWTLHPNDVLGRVWVIKDAAAPEGFRVFTTICPHLGCSVNLVENCFACPCHNARFEYSGTRINPHANPALRGMDELAWQRDSEDRERILVRYENFRAATAEKTTIQ